MSQPRATEREANFPQVEEGRAMPTQQKNTEFRVTTKHRNHVRITPRKCSAPQRASLCHFTSPLMSWVYVSCVSVMTKANRNKVNHSGQVRRKAKTGMFNNR
jgi:hypothetical protein